MKRIYFAPLLLIPLRPRCLPQHPIIEHPQPLYLPQCEAASRKKITLYVYAQLHHKSYSYRCNERKSNL